MKNRLPIVGIMGSGDTEWSERTTDLGRWLAGEGVHLLTGGGSGVMTSISRAFFEVPDRKGSVIGVLPCQADDPFCRPKKGYPNPWVEIPIATHLSLSGNQGAELFSRNHINILSSDIIIAFPGGAGTLSEVMLAEKYTRPLVAYLHDRSELPGLPPTVPMVNTLEGVQEFVKKNLLIEG
ncbi:MAG: molybdenum cofactor carrier protein [Nitrospirota bacterium]|nr:MAG: molybdenum cofactor carrier protein [Nitrospirota bacterium]